MQGHEFDPGQEKLRSHMPFGMAKKINNKEASHSLKSKLEAYTLPVSLSVSCFQYKESLRTRGPVSFFELACGSAEMVDPFSQGWGQLEVCVVWASPHPCFRH